MTDTHEKTKKALLLSFICGIQKSQSHTNRKLEDADGERKVDGEKGFVT